MLRFIQKMLRPLCFVLCLGICLGIAQSVLAFQDYDGAYIMRSFYQQEENSIDVITLGSSNVYVNINPAVLWESYGITSYNLASSMQTLSLSYYYLQEALKTQSPQLVVLDVFRVLEEYEYPYVGYAIKGVSGMQFSQTKIQAVQAVFTEALQQDYLLGFPASHNRYNALTESDFTHQVTAANALAEKGFFTSTTTRTVTQTDVSAVSECATLPESALEYLNKIIALTKEEGIELLLIKTPYGISESEQAYYNAVAQLAAAQDVPFVNFNLLYDEIGLDFSQDFTDYVHLNTYGSETFSSYYADYLAAHYTFDGQPSEAVAASYDAASAEWQRALYTASFARTEDWAEYLALLQGGEYTVVCTLSYFNGEVRDLTAQMEAITGHSLTLAWNSAFVLEGQEIVLCALEEGEFHWAAQTGDTTIFTITQRQGESAPTIQYEQAQYTAAYDAISIFVFDQQSNVLISAVSFDELLQLSNRLV